MAEATGKLLLGLALTGIPDLHTLTLLYVSLDKFKAVTRGKPTIKIDI